MEKAPSQLSKFITPRGVIFNTSVTEKFLPLPVCKSSLKRAQRLTEQSNNVLYYYPNKDMEKLLNPFVGRVVFASTIFDFGKYKGKSVRLYIKQDKVTTKPNVRKQIDELKAYLIRNSRLHGWLLSNLVIRFITSALSLKEKEALTKELKQNALVNVKPMTVEEILASK